MPNAVDRIEKLLGDAEAAGGMSRRDVALNVARDLGLHPHDPEPNPPISNAAKEEAKRAGMSDAQWAALTEAQRDQHRFDVATSSAGFASGTVPERLPASTSARVMSGGTSTPTNMVSSGGTARATSATVTSGGTAKADDKVTSGGSAKGKGA
jgi:hypothetical protein